MKILRWVVILAFVCCACGCAGLDETNQRILSGGAIGTAAGLGAAAIIGGPLIVGAAAGAAAGAVGGAVVDQVQGR
jgi:osmotically inducible lipoprotein OsmB